MWNDGTPIDAWVIGIITSVLYATFVILVTTIHKHDEGLRFVGGCGIISSGVIGIIIGEILGQPQWFWGGGIGVSLVCVVYIIYCLYDMPKRKVEREEIERKVKRKKQRKEEDTQARSQRIRELLSEKFLNTKEHMEKQEVICGNKACNSNHFFKNFKIVQQYSDHYIDHRYDKITDNSGIREFGHIERDVMVPMIGTEYIIGCPSCKWKPLEENKGSSYNWVNSDNQYFNYCNKCQFWHSNSFSKCPVCNIFEPLFGDIQIGPY